MYVLSCKGNRIKFNRHRQAKGRASSGEILYFINAACAQRWTRTSLYCTVVYLLRYFCCKILLCNVLRSAVLLCMAQHCAVLYCTVLCTVLLCSLLSCMALLQAALNCTAMLHCTVMYSSSLLHCTIIYYNVLSIALRCSTAVQHCTLLLRPLFATDLGRGVLCNDTIGYHTQDETLYPHVN